MKRALLILLVVAVSAYWLFGRDRVPQAFSDSVSTPESTPILVDVLANDADPADSALHVAAVGKPAHGSAELTPGGAGVNYIPADGYFGEDQFEYTVQNAAGKQMRANVRIDVTFASPEFRRRKSSATLSEMLTEPPTSIYGSTINVFAFRDDRGSLRELTVAGHADSATCSEFSGEFSKAMLNSPWRDGDFMLAGAGRMTVPEPGISALLSELEPTVAEYKTLAQTLTLKQWQVAQGEIDAEEAAAALGMSLADAKEKLAVLAKDANVATYLASVIPSVAAVDLLKRVQELQAQSGLVRLRTVPYSVVEAVQQRILEASKGNKPSLLGFDDLLAAPESEAVVYAPMLRLGGAEAIVLKVPAGDFSPAGLQRAAKEHRSTLEKAVLGSAKRRLEHANQSLAESLEDKTRCDHKSPVERQQFLKGEMKECNIDGCHTVANPRKIRYQEYCSKNVPDNIETSTHWRDQALEILANIEALRDDQSLGRMDGMTHAVLLDSMLRDWALPFPQAQEAFDYWRQQGRDLAWRTISAAAEKAGISRAALSGENLVFDVRQVGDSLEVRPLMIIDVRRSRLVIDDTLGVTATTTPWELRKVERLQTGPITPEQLVAVLKDTPERFAEKLIEAPGTVVTQVLDRLVSDLPADGAEWTARAAEAARVRGQVHMQALRRRLATDLAEPLTQDEAVQKLAESSSWRYPAREAPFISAEIRIGAAYAVQRMLHAASNQDPDAAWQRIRTMGHDEVESEHYLSAAGEQAMFGMPATDYVRGFVTRAMSEDPGAAAALLLLDTPPPFLASEADDTLPVLTALTNVAGVAEETRAALMLRNAIDRALAAYNADGRVAVSALKAALSSERTPGSQAALIRNELLLDLRLRTIGKDRDELGPIEGTQFVSTLEHGRNVIGSLLRENLPQLSALRFGRDQETMVVRMHFDEGDYVEALDSLTAAQRPLAQFSRDLRWTVLAPELQAVPKNVRLHVKGDSVVASARLPSGEADVLQLNGLDQRSRDYLAAQHPLPLFDWNKGNPLWEQILLARVPVAPDVASTVAALHQDQNYRALLKAMVYVCAVPATNLLDTSGRCADVRGSNRLYDRADTESGARIVVPDAEAMTQAAADRFHRRLPWRW